jgi:hypothetical protein
MTIPTAYCGLDCASCPIHQATLEDDEQKKSEMRATIARICHERYGMNLRPDEVGDCDGCHAESGRLFSGCRTCEIRTCAQGKNLESCAYCSEYACVRLQKLFVDDPSARTRLDALRQIH